LVQRFGPGTQTLHGHPIIGDGIRGLVLLEVEAEGDKLGGGETEGYRNLFA
jgi:hypothetical protein